MSKKVLFCFLLLFCCTSAFVQGQIVFPNNAMEGEDAWVRSKLNSLSTEEKIGQLFMVAAYSNKGPEHQKNLSILIENYHIGGLIFFQGGPGRQIQMINDFQKIAKTPLWFGLDGEWGLGMRLDSTMNFPKQMTLGAIENDSLIYLMGAEIARQFKRVGLHVNFAPVVDVNNNISNPVIGYRSFGEDKQNVARKGVAYMHGLQNYGVLANAKHFPGHGDTDTDSHYNLPVIKHSKERLNELELYPFKQLNRAGISSMMVAHLQVPAYEQKNNVPTTLSSAVVTDLLKKDIGFEGLIFTDALNMQAVAKYYEAGETDLLAFEAGNDVLLFPMNVPGAVKRIKAALKSGRITQSRLDESVEKILRAKYQLGLHEEPTRISSTNLHNDLSASSAKTLNRKLYANAATLLKSRNKYVPIKVLDTTSFASLSLRGDKNSAFQQRLDDYAEFTHYNLAKNDDVAEYSQLIQQLSQYETVIVGYHGLSNSPSLRFGVKEEDLLFLEALSERTNLVITLFGNAYSARYMHQFEHLLLFYEDNEITQQLAPEFIFGAQAFKGKIPVSAGSFKVGDGIKTQSLGRLGYASPEELGMDPEILNEIDKIAQSAVQNQATPGCQIIVARHGKIVLKKNFGYQTYDSLMPVTDETIYDLASITKVAATLQSIMFLHDQGLIDLDRKIYQYLPELKNSNKRNMILRDILTHQAGLTPWIPFWKNTSDNFSVKAPFYSNYPSVIHQNQLASGLYGHRILEDSIWKWVIESELLSKPKRQKKYSYRYSDVGYYMMQKIAESTLNLTYEEFLDQNLYTPLGLKTMGYNPLCHFNQDLIAPTELDKSFRNELMDGWVHDQGAAMMGGVAGHAGLFSNALDLAKLMQMNLWDGYYGGNRYFKSGTIPYYTKKQYDENRRGLGWDKPVEDDGPSPTSHYASALTFGHTGFTGTAAWADPEYGLVYIFLSNRIHPDASNRKLISQNVRTRIMDKIYKSIFAFENIEEISHKKS